MKIMHVVLSLRIGGLENLVLKMSELQSGQGHEVIVCSLERQDKDCSLSCADGLRTVYLNRCGGKDFAALWGLYRLLRRERPDIVHTHNNAALIYGALAARLAGIKGVINTRHGEVPFKRPSVVWNANNFVVAISESARTVLTRDNNIDHGKVRVVRNGIGLEPYKDSGAGRVKDAGRKNIIGTVCRLDSYKDIPTLISAFEKVLAVLPDTGLWIVGDGDKKDYLNDLVKAKGLDGRIAFLGWRKDIPDLNRQMDVFILPSITEGISLSLLEAMACGCPVVATRVGGNPEVVVDGTTGFLVPSKDPDKMAEAIMRLLKDRQLARRMGEAARQRVQENFSLERMVGEYEALYRECVSKTVDRRP